MPRSRDKAPAEGIDPKGWMLTFSDLITLLLTFFVMLLSMSTMDMQKVQKIISSFTGGGGKGVLEMTDVGKISSMEEELRRLSQLKLDQLPKERLLEDIFFGKKQPGARAVFAEMAEEVKVEKRAEGIALVFGAKLLFDPGRADLKPAAMPVLAKLALIMRQVDRPVSIEGHTDNVPLKGGGRFKSNWDLSMARALAVQQVLVDRFGVSPWRMRVAAMADSRPVASNDTPEGRAKNRRIEVVFVWLN